MIKCILIDDEPVNVNILRKMLAAYCPEISVIGEAFTAADALSVIRQTSPQLVFMDIEMPGQNAFDILNELMPVNFEIIFVTAFDHYAIRAIKYSALGYLLKPVGVEDLIQAINKAVQNIQQKNINQRLRNLLAGDIMGNNQLSNIALPSKDGLLFYPIDDIICCTAQGTYTEFDFVNEKTIIVTGTLKDFEAVLPAALFCRVHNSYLVNLKHVKKYYKGKGGHIEMVNGKTVEVSFRKRDEFLSRIRP
jgi:two-component system LytT family response regulator